MKNNESTAGIRKLKSQHIVDLHHPATHQPNRAKNLMRVKHRQCRKMKWKWKKKLANLIQETRLIEENYLNKIWELKVDDQQYEEQATERIEDDDRQMLEETMEETGSGEFVPDEPTGRKEVFFEF
jgi:hypothetical protein